MIPELKMVVRLNITPVDLRGLAVIEEESWKATVPGSPTVFAVRYGAGIAVEFAFDQERMESLG